MRSLSFVGFFVYFTQFTSHDTQYFGQHRSYEGASSDIKTNRSCVRLLFAFLNILSCGVHTVCTPRKVSPSQPEAPPRRRFIDIERVLECIKYFFLSFSSYRQCVQISHNKQQFFLFVGYTFCEIYNII